MHVNRIALLSLALVVGCQDKISGLPPGFRSIELANFAEGISGTAAISDAEGPTSSVAVTLRGVTLGQVYTGRIVSGTCSNTGSVSTNLNSVTASTTSVQATTSSVPDSVLTAGHAIAYLRGSTTVACGNIN
jgi:hypothetical protein